MGFLHIVEPAANHRCDLPKGGADQYGEGTVWKCDGCGQIYVFSHDRDPRGGGWYWMKDYRYVNPPNVKQ